MKRLNKARFNRLITLSPTILMTLICQFAASWVCPALAEPGALPVQRLGADSFNPTNWKSYSGGDTRLTEWKKFLASFDIIDMHRDRVVELLGDADNWNKNDKFSGRLLDYLPDPTVPDGHFGSYALYSTTTCGRGAHSLQILFNSALRVEAWRINSFGMTEHWFKENFVFLPGKAFQFDEPNFGLTKKTLLLPEEKGRIEGPRDVNICRVEPMLLDKKTFDSGKNHQLKLELSRDLIRGIKRPGFDVFVCGPENASNTVMKGGGALEGI